MRTYYVVSQEYSTVVPILDDGTGPLEPVVDVVMIRAKNARDAVMLGVKEILRTQRRSMASDNRSDNLPPWAGYRAERVNPRRGSK